MITLKLGLSGLQDGRDGKVVRVKGIRILHPAEGDAEVEMVFSDGSRCTFYSWPDSERTFGSIEY